MTRKLIAALRTHSIQPNLAAKQCDSAHRATFVAKMRGNTQCQTNPHPPRLRQADNPPLPNSHTSQRSIPDNPRRHARKHAPRLSDGRRSSEPAAAQTRGTSTRPRSRPPLQTTGQRQWPVRGSNERRGAALDLDGESETRGGPGHLHARRRSRRSCSAEIWTRQPPGCCGAWSRWSAAVVVVAWWGCGRAREPTRWARAASPEESIGRAERK
jgi:hypothetical protein